MMQTNWQKCLYYLGLHSTACPPNRTTWLVMLHLVQSLVNFNVGESASLKLVKWGSHVFIKMKGTTSLFLTIPVPLSFFPSLVVTFHYFLSLSHFSLVLLFKGRGVLALRRYKNWRFVCIYWLTFFPFHFGVHSVAEQTNLVYKFQLQL